MKKLLALVLALVMTLSLAVVGSNAAFKDAEKVNASYAEAVDVLAGMKVFQGYPDGSFQPEGSITRAEVAAIVYRLYTADVADKQASLYATYNKFADMDGAAWAKGYIGYCGNAGLIKGYDAKTFGPADKVTGYQALAMILRAVGYDKNDEFTGAQWQLRVASTAQQLGILKNVKGVDLNAAASRELVAELLFRTAAEVPMVTYTPALGYTNLTAILNGKANATLGEKNFGLTKTAASNDKWGRPLYKWTDGKTTVYATIKATPVATYTKAVTECDVAHDAGLKVDTAYTLYVNGDKLNAKYIVNLTDTVTKMGAQGRLIEVYDDTIVMIDTFLAKVTYVAAATYDAQNHLKTPATITLEAYEAGTINPTTQLKSAKATAYTLTNGKTNYEYAVGDYVLLNAFTAVAGNTATESGAITTTTATKPGDIVGKATSIDGAQSIIYWNSKQHNVEGTIYDDAVKFWLDEAGKESTKHTWFFDQYNNLIGSVEIAAATSYGVINSIWWAGNAADGSGVAKANVTYMDGTTGQVDISEMTYYTNTTAGTQYAGSRMTGTVTHSTNYVASASLMQAVRNFFYVDSYATENARTGIDTNGILNGHLFQFTTKANGTMKAIEVAGNGEAQAEVAASTTGPVYYESAIPAGFYNTTVAVSKNTQVYRGSAWQLVVNDNTTFLIRTATATGYTFASVKGFTNVGSYVPGEVDFVDVNGDKVADYVYVTAASATSKVTSLFYFDGQQGAYTLADGTWVVKGYVDGEPGEVKFANYAALNGTLTKGSPAVATAPEANTLYFVSLEDGVVVAGHKAVDNEVVDANDANHPLAAAYASYSNVTLKIAYVEGDAGTAAASYADRDTYIGSVYHDYNANMYYSVISGTSKIVGTMGTPANQNYYFVYVNTAGAHLDQFCPQAYAFDKSAVVTNGVVTATTVSVTTGAKAGNLVSSVEFAAAGTGTNITTPVALDVTAKWQRYWVNPTTGAATWVDCIDGEVFQTTTQYRALMTLSVPSAQSANITIAPTNAITYPAGSTTGTGVQIYTDAFTPTV